MAVKILEVPLIGDVNEDEARIALAADTAQLTLWDFLYELGKRKVSYTNITVDDLQEELDEI